MDWTLTDNSHAREREIAGWLCRRVELADAERQMDEAARQSKESRLRVRTPLWMWAIWLLGGLWLLSAISWLLMTGLNRIDKCPSLREWFEASAQPGDELWQYDSGPDTWEHLAGECGYAIVRGGKVVDYWMEANN